MLQILQNAAAECNRNVLQELLSCTAKLLLGCTAELQVLLHFRAAVLHSDEAGRVLNCTSTTSCLLPRLKHVLLVTIF